ncbi:hypothetical protein B0H63DRAFT_144518 [Podospora didyma]|uniref:Mid2 domain-containing protein n=1 Tax=Podospora didyma TaxID=330526 RepID=A0AAE0U122_9PEZI|nr:hypothetical protein B0H63DRAFT_144518 [Podospora didyma]
MTVIGPLTTIFKPPPSCTAVAPQIFQTFTDKSRFVLVQGPVFPDSPSCFPNGYDASPTNYYSPAACPNGYTAACASSTVVKAETETALVCCPNLSYTCPTSTTSVSGQASPLACATSLSGGAVIIIPGVNVVSDGTTRTYQIISVSTGVISAYGVQVRFKSTDPTATPIGSSSPSSTTSASQTSIPSSTFTLPPILDPPASTQTQASSGSVSTAAAIGIGVGSAIAALFAALTIGIFLYMRMRRKRRAEVSSALAIALPPPVPPKGPAPSYRAIAPPYELSEEVSPRHDRHMSKVAFPRGSMFSGNPAELEANPSEGSFRDRAASPDSQSTAWSERQARGGVMPMPWI